MKGPSLAEASTLMTLVQEILRLKYEQGLSQARLDIPPHA
jgi:hypothetical protein